jgi:Ca-activated chloride channel family protein
VIEQFHFLRPGWLLLLLPLAAIMWLLVVKRYDTGSWRAVIDERLLPYLLADGGDSQRSGMRWILGSVALLAIVALAGPTWEKIPQPVYQKETALVIALDLSRSMNAADIKPNRLTRARHKIADILNLRKEGQTALVVYAADAFTVTPLTTDVDTILALLPHLESELMPAQGTRADRAIGLALELFKNSGIARGDVLLISDGLSALELERVEILLDRQPGQRVSVLAVGTREGGPVPLKNGGFLKDRAGAIVVATMLEENLRHIARVGGGVYATISASDLDINALAYVMDSSIDNRAARLSDSSADLWRELGPGLLLLALPFAALAFRRGLLWLLPLYLVVLPPDVQAFDWPDLWQSRDQRAGELFRQGEHATAAGLFDDPQWQASAHYRAGDFATALETWQQVEGEDAAYNRGNALAKLGQYEDAIAAYDALLERNPAHEDARYNKQAIEDWLRNQQSQQGEQQSEQQGDNQQQSEQQGDNQQQPQQGESQSQAQDSQSADDAQPQQADSDQPQQQESGQSQQQEQQSEQSTQQAEAKPSGDDPEQHSQAEESMARLDQQMSEQAAEQWLRKIPDDPGGLLRRKFIYQYRQRGGVDAEAKSW